MWYLFFVAKVDYQYKSKVLTDFPDLVKDMRLLSRAVYLFSKSHNLDDPIIVKALQVGEKYYYNPLRAITTNKLSLPGIIRYPYEAPIKEAIRLNYAFYARKRRLEKHISSMFSRGICLFVRLSFRDDVLESTSFSTRRQYVHRFLRSLSHDYVANVDYGETNDREHYHAIIRMDRYPVGSWPYGYDFVEVCKSQVNDSARLSKYISKLTNHAYKESAKRYSIIYSKLID